MNFKKLFIDYKKEVAILVIVLISVAVIASLVGYNKGNREFNEGVKQLEASYMKNNKEEYETLIKEKESLEKQVEKLEEKVDDLVADADELRKEKHSLEDEIDLNIEKINKIEEYETLVSELENGIKDLESESTRLNLEKASKETEIADLQAEIDKLNGKLVEAAGSPMELSAGMWFQEIDEIPVGRYTVSNGDGNFFVRDEDGIAYVNIILDDSNSGWGVTDYTFVLIEGAMIENDSPCILTPVN